MLVIGYIVASSLTRPSPPTYPVAEPTYPVAEPEAEAVGDRLVRGRRVTLDARDPDRWVRFDFSRGAVVPNSAPSWDLAVRRFRIIVNGGPGFSGRGGAMALHGTPFDSVRHVPESGYRPTEGDPAGDPEHPVLEDWYRYDLFSHMLLTRGRPYAIRTADGRYAVIEVVSYYCPGPEPGCLTLRYHYQGDGSRRMVRRDSTTGAASRSRG